MNMLLTHKLRIHIYVPHIWIFRNTEYKNNYIATLIRMLRRRIPERIADETDLHKSGVTSSRQQ